VPRPAARSTETNAIESQAGNDQLRPQLNDDRRRRFGPTGRMLALVCECNDPLCHRTVVLTAEEYDALRPGPVIQDRKSVV